MPDQRVIDAIARIVGYNWADEEKDYNTEALEEGNSREGHIFGDLMTAQAWLEEHGVAHVEPRIGPGDGRRHGIGGYAPHEYQPDFTKTGDPCRECGFGRHNPVHI